MVFAGGVRIEATYVSCDVRRVFAIVSLPLSDSRYGVQLRMMDFIFSWMVAKFLSSCSSLLSISNPRMVKLSLHAIPSSGHKMSFGLFLAPTGIMWVLSRLHANPEIRWN